MVTKNLERRHFLALSALLAKPGQAVAARAVTRSARSKITIGLNAYSFNRPLMAGTMKLEDVVEYCAAQNIDGLDATGYYFPGYPAVPSDSYIYNLKRKAFLEGVTISGTGVRNDFTLPDPAARKAQVQLVKDWIVVAQKLGADVVRVYSGLKIPQGYTFDQVLEWLIPTFQECAAFGRDHGVMCGLQQHNDFLKTADETIKVVEAVDSPWFNVVLDVGSLRQGDPYQEIKKLLPYASTWQIKEQVWYGQRAAPIDLPKIKALIDKVGYRGFTPIEALGAGDPKEIVTAFLRQVRKAFLAV